MLRFICGQPGNAYFKWQLQVMLHNFVVKCEIPPERIDVVCSIEGDMDTFRKGLVEAFPGVSFYFYEDTRARKHYIPSIRPHLFAKHFAAHPHLSKETFFFCDSDVVFTRPSVMDALAPLCEGPDWVASDVGSYIGPQYIKSKGHGIYERMCDIVGIDKDVPESREEHTGGAQWIMKGLTAEYWSKVEKDCLLLYDMFVQDLTEHPKTDAYEPIQKWTAEMWAVLWNAWFFGHTVRCHPSLKFAWATSPVSEWHERLIYHNAGIMSHMSDAYFYKGAYLNHPPYVDVAMKRYNPQFATHKYVDNIRETYAYLKDRSWTCVMSVRAL